MSDRKLTEWHGPGIDGGAIHQPSYSREMTPSQTSLTRRLKLSSDPTLRRRFMVVDEPVKANIRVGLLIEVLDKLAEHTALRHARKAHPAARVVTAAMDDLKVCNPPDINGDII